MTEPAASESITAQQGLRFEASEPAKLQAAIDAAVDYRGDVTVIDKSRGRAVVGYVFDQCPHDDPARAMVRIIEAETGEKLSIALDQIEAVEFTGRDTAAGKSFETWVKKFVSRKLAGETASIESEPLEDG